MPRKLRPCGTRAAYQRHLYNKEEPCDACKAANVVRAMSAPSGGGKKAREIDTSNRYVTDGDLALQLDPPRIEWRLDPVRRIQVAVSVDDPHAENAPTRREARSRSYASEAIPEFIVSCERGHEFDSWNTIVNPDGSYACRICTAHLDNGPLIDAARKAI